MNQAFNSASFVAGHQSIIMKHLFYGLISVSQYLRHIFLPLVLISVIMLNSCSAYRAEKLKNKSYKAWQEQLKQEKQPVDADKLSGKL